MLISIYYSYLSKQDFLFELESQSNMLLFTYIVDVSLSNTLIRNKDNVVV